MVILAAAMPSGCATAASRGELAVEIETPVPMAYISLVHARTSELAEIGNIPDGSSAHLEKLRPGLWCITGYVDASGGFARVYQLQSPTCDYVEEAGHAELRLVREGNALLVRSDAGARPGHLPQGPRVRSPADVEQIVGPARAQLGACIADAQL
ncbi:MAG: hypothetical protein IAG13_13620, partial [Deltaproteobacteria bacterium]|nr:hypothetical protein [Nannocystaceae bacterium]